MSLSKKFHYYVISLMIPLLNNSLSNSVTYFFAHGLANNHKQVYNYTKIRIEKRKNVISERYILDHPFVTFNFPDAKGLLAKVCRVNFIQTSLAQANEIDATMQAYKSINDPQGAVIMGVSRGAAVATVFAGVVASSPAKITVAPIRALVLESPFDSFLDALNDKITQPWLRSLAQSLVKYGMPFFKHDTAGKQPIDIVKLIPTDLPILLICSKEDCTVLPSSTIRLYTRLRKTGHINTYLLELTGGDHAKLLDGPEGRIYHNVAHAFYKLFGLPHEGPSANIGMPILRKCQPDYP